MQVCGKRWVTCMKTVGTLRCTHTAGKPQQTSWVEMLSPIKLACKKIWSSLGWVINKLYLAIALSVVLPNNECSILQIQA